MDDEIKHKDAFDALSKLSDSDKLVALCKHCLGVWTENGVLNAEEDLRQEGNTEPTHLDIIMNMMEYKILVPGGELIELTLRDMVDEDHESWEHDH